MESDNGKFKVFCIPNELPFQLRRKQYLVVPAFAMPINKAQGQSLHHLGLFLSRPVFAHGLLYVALSRVTSRSNIKIIVVDPVFEGEEGVFTKNVGYREIFD